MDSFLSYQPKKSSTLKALLKVDKELWIERFLIFHIVPLIFLKINFLLSCENFWDIQGKSKKLQPISETEFMAQKLAGSVLSK